MDFAKRLNDAHRTLWPRFFKMTRAAFLADEMMLFASEQCWLHWSDKEAGEMSALMATAGRRFFIDYRRRERTRCAHERARPRSYPLTPGPMEELNSTPDAATLVRQGVAQLPEPLRDVIDRTFFCAQTNQQVAKALGLPLTTVKNWKHQAYKRLRRILGSDR